MASSTGSVADIRLKDDPEHLRVLVLRDGESWFAQALEVDYFSGSNDDVTDLINRFMIGLKATVDQQTDASRPNLLTAGPGKYWRKWFDSADELVALGEKSTGDWFRPWFSSVRFYGFKS